MFCLSSSCVLCARSCQCLWIVHSWLPHSVFSNVYTVNCKSFCFVNIHNFKRSIVFSDKTCLGQENDRAYYKCLSWELLPILNLISDFVYMYIYMYLRLLRYPTLFTCMYSTTMFWSILQKCYDTDTSANHDQYQFHLVYQYHVITIQMYPNTERRLHQYEVMFLLFVYLPNSWRYINKGGIYLKIWI